MRIDPKFGAIHMHGDVRLNNTIIIGLSRIHRVGDAHLGNDVDGNFSAKISFGDSKLKLHSDVKVHINKTTIHPNLKLDANIGDIELTFSAVMDGDGRLGINKFNIDQLKHVSIQVHGLSVLDPLVEIIADGYIQLANSKARHLIVNIVRPIIEKELKNVKLN